ncbi:MAG: flagellar protein FlgN [Candidatus Rokubacteria bacterium]|nr:flagellar protein FlgN [Candidatus Rokubacteria bacterium]
MIARVEDLLALLGQEAGTYQRLLGILREEEGALLAGRYSEVATSTPRKETLLLELRLLAESRGVLLTRLAEAFELPPSALTLARLVTLVDEPHATQLLEVRTRLTQTLAEIAQASRGLGLLLERSLFRISEILRILRESLGLGPQYDPTGRLLLPAFPVLNHEA